MRGRNGDSFGQERIGKLLAVLWILTAALAMQFVASAQGLSLRVSAQLNAGNFSGTDSDTTDPALSRHVIRAAPVADVRFSAERSDGKAVPGGPDAPILPFRPSLDAFLAFDSATQVFAALLHTGMQSHHARARAPPAAAV